MNSLSSLDSTIRFVSWVSQIETQVSFQSSIVWRAVAGSSGGGAGPGSNSCLIRSGSSSKPPDSSEALSLHMLLVLGLRRQQSPIAVVSRLRERNTSSLTEVILGGETGGRPLFGVSLAASRQRRLILRTDGTE